MKKYELVKDRTIQFLGRTLFQIQAVREVKLNNGDIVKAGDLGGYIESEQNLSQEDSAWVGDIFNPR